MKVLGNASWLTRGDTIFVNCGDVGVVQGFTKNYLLSEAKFKVSIM